MIYILHQRLRAQKVPIEKETKVLREVICAMLDASFIAELFQPQDMYTSASTRQIFDRMAHSSLMRLNKTSMDKLFDLMTMSFKHQVLNCRHPREYFHMTLLHLQSLRNIASGHNATMQLLDNTETQLLATYGPKGPCSGMGALIQLKQTLYSYVQDKKVRASLFLQHDIQAKNGMFILSLKGPLPFGTTTPGLVRVLDRGRPKRTYNTSIRIHSAKQTIEAVGPWNGGFDMGCNMYSMNSSRMCTENSESDKSGISRVLSRLEFIEVGGNSTYQSISAGSSPGSIGTPGSSFADGSYLSQVKSASPGKSMNAAAAKAERNLTESLLGRADSKGLHGPVNLASLIPTSNTLNDDGSGGGGGAILDVDMDILEFDAAAGAKTLDSMMGHLNLHDNDSKPDNRGGSGAKASSANSAADAKGGGAGSDDEESDDDLLALMDGMDCK